MSTAPTLPELLDQFDALEQAGQAEGPEAARLMVRIIRLAPPAVQQQIMAEAQLLGLVPPPTGYSASGQPLWDATELGRHLGMSPAEVHATLDEHDIQPVAVPVHRVQ